MLKVSNITKKFDDKVILDDVSFDIKPGTITSIIGPSGSGKTTLLKTIGMLELAELGTISIDEKVYQFPTTIEGREPWPKLTIVFQQLFMWPHLTLKQNILLPLGDVKKSEKMEELIDLFQMREFIERYPNQASIGQKQRVALVRALVLNPDYLFLDEITSALDIEQVGIVLNYLQGLKAKGMGILLVTHLLNFAKRASDQILFLDNGKIIERGSAEILKNPDHPRIKKFISIVESAS